MCRLGDQKLQNFVTGRLGNQTPSLCYMQAGKFKTPNPCYMQVGRLTPKTPATRKLGAPTPLPLIPPNLCYMPVGNLSPKSLRHASFETKTLKSLLHASLKTKTLKSLLHAGQESTRNPQMPCYMQLWETFGTIG